jgi:hypothetical protein
MRQLVALGPGILNNKHSDTQVWRKSNQAIDYKYARKIK